MVLPGASVSISTPLSVLGIGGGPGGVCADIVPSTTLDDVPEPWSSTPSALLPEMTFCAAAVVPPMVLPDAPLSTSTPSLALGIAAVPAALTPIKLPATRLSVAVSR